MSENFAISTTKKPRAMFSSTSYKVLNISGDNPLLSRMLIQLVEDDRLQFVGNYQPHKINF